MKFCLRTSLLILLNKMETKIIDNNYLIENYPRLVSKDLLDDDLENLQKLLFDLIKYYENLSPEVIDILNDNSLFNEKFNMKLRKTLSDLYWLKEELNRG